MVKSSQQKEKLHQLYALYEQPLYRIAYAILHQPEQAEDAVSDAFLKIIPHLDQIESPDSPKTKAFLIQVIRNTAINQYRKNAKDAERLTNIDDSTLQVPSPRCRCLFPRCRTPRLFRPLSETETKTGGITYAEKIHSW